MIMNIIITKHHHNNHPHGHSLSQQYSHAHVYTLAGNPPNVVDFTSNEKTTTTTATSNNNSRTTTKRPWSKQSRALRNATINDITAQGMIRSSSSSSGGITQDFYPMSPTKKEDPILFFLPSSSYCRYVPSYFVLFNSFQTLL